MMAPIVFKSFAASLFLSGGLRPANTAEPGRRALRGSDCWQNITYFRFARDL